MLCLTRVLTLCVCALVTASVVAASPLPTPPVAEPRNELYNYDPTPDPASVVTSGTHARFTVLTPHLIRMEYAAGAGGVFVDEATLAFVHRRLPAPKFKTWVEAGLLHIVTSAVHLKYTVGQKFTTTTLSATSSSTSATTGKPLFEPWQYGEAQEQNLLGTIRGLDGLTNVPLNCTEIARRRIRGNDGENLHCAWGVVSRAGWATVDDATNYLVDGPTNFWTRQNPNVADTYLFAYGHAYEAALADFVKVAGRVAMVPRYMSGIMYTRWYDYTHDDFNDVVDDYAERSLPLDMMVMDMNWHTKHAWTGYSPDMSLMPFPDDTMSMLHARGLHTGANLHDDGGIGTWEDSLYDMQQALGLSQSSKTSVPFSMVNQSYTHALEDVTIKGLERTGIDVWWIDWQQGGTQGGCAGLKQNPTFKTGQMRGTDYFRRAVDKRAVVLARWGGLGSHRYQMGFSGDVNGLTWQNLAYQPYFSMTASNVAYGFWSHDLVGPATNHELHTRWLQWGAYSGAFRTHDRGGSAGACHKSFPTSPNECWIVRPYNVPLLYYRANRAAMTERAALLPYIYTAVREAYESGGALVRPMYYDWPEEPRAYAADHTGAWPQYMFRRDMLVAPVVVPTGPSFTAGTSIWLPPSTLWIERATGCVIDSSALSYQGIAHVFRKDWAVQDVPVFIRAGAVIPTQPIVLGDTLGVAQRAYAALTFSLYPGGDSGEASVYEDDGHTMAYLRTDGTGYATTRCSYVRAGMSATTVKIATTGMFETLPKQRPYTLRLVNGRPLKSVTVNGQPLPYRRFGGIVGNLGSWTYDGVEMTTVVSLPPLAVSATPIVVKMVEIDVDVPLSCMRGMLEGVRRAKASLDETRQTPGSQTSDFKRNALKTLASAPAALSALAGRPQNKAGQNFAMFVQSLPSMYRAASTEIQSLDGHVEKNRQSYVRAMFAWGLVGLTKPHSAWQAGFFADAEGAQKAAAPVVVDGELERMRK